MKNYFRNRISRIFVCFERSAGHLSQSGTYSGLDITHNQCSSSMRREISSADVYSLLLSLSFSSLFKMLLQKKKKINLLPSWWTLSKSFQIFFLFNNLLICKKLHTRWSRCYMMIITMWEANFLYFFVVTLSFIQCT